jgi:hypothetical protein
MQKRLQGYHSGLVSDPETAFPSPPAPTQAPVDPLYSHAASPFMRTEPPAAVEFAGPSPGAAITPMSTLLTHKTQIQFGFAILAYLMVLVGSITVVEANRGASWQYYVVVLPVIPAAIVIWLTVRALSRLDEVQKRTQMQALGFSMAATGLLTFGYGFLEGMGMPHLNSTFVLPLMALLWGLGTLALSVRYRLRR